MSTGKNALDGWRAFWFGGEPFSNYAFEDEGNEAKL